MVMSSPASPIEIPTLILLGERGKRKETTYETERGLRVGTASRSRTLLG
jgi:hypothetical protein